MRTVIQRVLEASVSVNGQTIGSISHGLVALVAVLREDGPTDVAWTARKIAGLRIFRSSAGAYDLDVTQVRGAILLVSNFTVAADCSSGRRPALSAAMSPGEARPLFEQLIAQTRASGVEVATGVFAAEMQVRLINDGPLTLILDSRD